MELFHKQIMQVRDMYLKKSKFLFFVFIMLFGFQNSCFSKEVLTDDIIEYLSGLRNFSASFIQSDDDSLVSEGVFFIGQDRIRVEYKVPNKILIILDEDKAMYYDYELEEDEFFDPKNTSSWFFFDIFKNPNFFRHSVIVDEGNYLIIKKNGFNENYNYKIKITFENNPMIIRKINLFVDDLNLTISIFDHTYNNKFSDDFFKLINPSFFE